MKHIVIFLRSNPIRPDSRVEKEASCLVKAGYSVKILAWDRDSNHKASNETITTFGVEIPIIRFGFKAQFGAGLSSIRQYLLFQYSMYKWLKKNRNSYEIIHACDFDTAFTAAKIKRKYKKKMVFDIFDFLASDPKNLFQTLIKKLQINIINQADATIICTEERKKQIEGASPQKLCVIHNTPPALLINDNGKLFTNVIRICYVGILQDYRLLDILPQFFIQHRDIEFHVGGFGKYEQLYSDLSKKYNNIMFYGRIPYDKTLELEKSCDIMLAIYDPSIDNHRFAAPNKFYESLILGRPIIMVKGTGMSNVVEENNIGETIEYNLESFSEGIKKLIAKKNQWPIMAKQMHDIYNKFYSWEEMKIRLLNMYSSLN